MKITIEKFDIELLADGSIYYERSTYGEEDHPAYGEEKAGRITMINQSIDDYEGPYSIPLSVLSTIHAIGWIDYDSFCREMSGKYSISD